MNATDGDLLRRFIRDRSEAAFEELVRRHLGLVYSAALRQVNHDTHLAQDVTQVVFADLARKAPRLARHGSIAGWLYTSTRFAASTVRRSELRRLNREKEAHAMQEKHSDEPQADWNQISPLLDEAMHALPDEDREAVLMRHFELQSYSEIGAHFGLSENAARMRVDRALEKLRTVLARNGITSSTLALASVLGANAIESAPVALVPSITQKAMVAASGSASVAISNFVASWLVKSAAALLVATIVLTLFMATRDISISREVSMGIVSNETNSAAALISNLTTFAGSSEGVSTGLQKPVGPTLRLEILAADSGKPVPLVEFQTSHEAGVWPIKTSRADRFGICEVFYRSNVPRLEIWAHTEGFADTCLLWRPDRGEVIPTNYVLRLDRPAPMSGRVVDDEGKPVAGARIEWHLTDNPGAVETVPENHEFPWILLESDVEGRWRTERVAADVFRRLRGTARHTDYLDGQYVDVSGDPRAETALRNGTHEFKMRRATNASGIVTDSSGQPIGGAEVLIGRNNYGGSREGQTSAGGAFSIAGCAPGLQWISARAGGYAATTVAAELSANAPPVHLVLERGKVLRLRVLNRAGEPVPGATVFLNLSREVPQKAGPAPQVQMGFQEKCDSNGRLVWTNAPEGELRFGFIAPGYVEVENILIPADDVEHPVTLASSVVIQGTVRNEVSGRLLPRFRIGLGYPAVSNGKTNAEWARFDRFWVEYTNGAYRYSCDEPLVRRTDGENRGYILKFEAAGYASQVSRIIGPDEGTVQMDVTLRPASSTFVTVFKPDGRPAANADVGLVFPGSPLQLVPGGLSHEVDPGGAHMVTDKSGSFELRPDDSVDRVVVACAEGYAETTRASLVANPILQLQAWGRLEVHGMSVDAAERKGHFTFKFGTDSLLEAHYARFSDPFETAGQRNKVFSRLPPGHHKLIRWPQREEMAFEIRAGEATTLNLTDFAIADTAPATPSRETKK